MSVSYFKDKASKIINWLSRRGIIATTAYDGLVNYFRSRSSLSSGTLEDDINDVCSVGTDAYNGSVQGDMILATGIGHPADAERAFWNSDNVDFGNIPKSISGLQAWYKADSSVYSDGAVQLTANNREFLSIASNSTLQAGDIDFSWCGWVYLDSLGAEKTILSKMGGGNIEYIAVITSGNQLQFSVYDGSAVSIGSATYTTTTLTSATWYFVYCYHDSVNNLVGCSVNNGTAITSATTGTAGTNTQSFYFGLNTSADNYMNGRLDSFLFYKKLLSSAELTWLYNSGSGRMISDLYNSNAPSGITTSLISGWGFNEPTGVRYDYVGTNHLTETFGGIISPSINNGGFETLGGGGADVFASWTENPGTATITADASSYAGSWACKIAATGTTGQIYQNLSLLTGKTYYAECYAKKTTSFGTEYIALRIGGASSGTPGGGISFSPTASYAKYVATYRNTGNGFMYIDCANGDIFVDNVTVQAAEILGTSGIAAGLAKDQNFCASFPAPASTSNYLSASDNASLDFSGSFTIAGWVNYDSLTQTGDSIIVQKASTQYRLLGIGYPGGGTTQLYFDVNSSGAITRSINLSDWVFVVAEWNASTLQTSLTVNQGTAATGSSTQPAATSTALTVGSRTYGRIDSLGMWSRTLTTAEKTYLFNLGRGRKYAELGLSGTDGSNLLTNCSAFWNLDESSGTRVDSMGVNNLSVNGTVNQGQGVNYQEGIVSRWNDLSGNGYYYSQATNSKRPGYRTSSVNGRPALFFDGIDDVMAQTGGMGTFNNKTGGTIIIVRKNITSPATEEVHIVYLNNSTGARLLVSSGNSANKYSTGGRRLDADVSATINSSGSVSTSDFVIQTSHVDWANSNIYQYINGTLDGSSTSFQTDGSTSATDSSNIILGGFTTTPTYASDISVCEIIVYSRYLTSAELNLLHRYLGGRYAITVATI